MPSSASAGPARSSSATPSSRSSAGRRPTTTTRSGRRWRHWRSAPTLLEPEDGGEPLEVRIGLATGEVVAAARGDGTGDQAVTGEAITTAARIQGLARPGEILLDEATVRGGPRPAVGRGSRLGRPPWPVAGGPPLLAERPIRADRPRLAPADPGYAAGRSDDGAGPRSTRAQAGTALGTRRRRPRDRRSRHGQVAPRGRRRERGPGPGLRLDLDGERLLRTRRAVPVRPAVRPG